MRGVRDGWAKIGQVPDRTGDRVAAGAVHEVTSATSVLRQTELGLGLARRKLSQCSSTAGQRTGHARCFGALRFASWPLYCVVLLRLGMLCKADAVLCRKRGRLAG